MKRAEYLAELIKQSTDATKTMEDFRKEFDEKPYQAMRWADGVFHAAAVVELNAILIGSVSNGNTRRNIAAWLRREINDKAAHAESSSNLSGNLLARMSLNARANALRALLNGDVGAGVIAEFEGEQA